MKNDHITTLLLVVAGITLPIHPAAAFPLDPVRIFARDKSPTPGALDVEASVWQGGDAFQPGAGRRIYLETRSVETESTGHFDFWLGEGVVREGELRGDEYGLDKSLRLELRYIEPDSQRTILHRFHLFPIDNAYIATSRPKVVRKPGANDGLQGVYDKEYRPDFKEFAPDLVRRGVATLYPDGRLQAEDGAFVDIEETTTSGVQELFDYCTEHRVDGYIVGGAVPRAQQVVYRCWSPVRMHPAQGIRIDTGAITLQFLPDVGEQPGLTIDSCMMNDIRIRGLIHYLGKGCAVSVRPENPLPLDRFVGNTFVDTAVSITSITCKDAGGALEFDGEVNFSRFTVGEINHGGIGIHVKPGSAFSNNRITCKHVHGQTQTSVLDEAGAANVWEVNLNCDAQDPRGIVTAGRDSIWMSNVNSRGGPGLVLQKSARGNQFFLMGLNGGIQNDAQTPTNRIYPSMSTPAEKLGAGFARETPTVPQSGVAVTNREPLPVVVMIKDPANVVRWELTDSYGVQESIDAPLHAGQGIHLGVGESIRLHYHGAPPEWRWRAVP